MPQVFNADGYTDVTVTPEMALLKTATDSQNLDHCCFHGYFTGPPMWSGMYPVAAKTGQCPYRYHTWDPTLGKYMKQDCQGE